MKDKLQNKINSIQHVLDEADIAVEIKDASDERYEDALAWLQNFIDTKVAEWKKVVRMMPKVAWDQYKLYSENEQTSFREVRLRRAAIKEIRREWRSNRPRVFVK